MFTERSPFTCYPSNSAPYEREYEGWITRGMEDYFREIGVELTCMAVGPTQEKMSGIDEFCRLPGKYFGLQFKRAKERTASAIGWDLNAAQTKLIKENGAMWYALPTFLNRNLRRVALHHVVFWRPGILDGERIHVTSSGAVYVHSKTSGEILHSNLSSRQQRALLGEKAADYGMEHAYRWGRFAEGLLSCSIGALYPTEWCEIDPEIVFDSELESFKNHVAEYQRRLERGESFMLARLRTAD